MSRKRKTRFDDLPYHLTAKEIKALREDFKQAEAEATRILAKDAKRKARRTRPVAVR